MTKRILAILLAVLMLGIAVACTGSDNPADTDDDTNASTDAPAKEGCGSVIGLSAVAVLAAASAFVALKKKKER